MGRLTQIIEIELGGHGTGAIKHKNKEIYGSNGLNH